MSYSALGKDGNKHYADDFNDPYKGEYHCPNSQCRVRMILKNLGLDEKHSAVIRPYFSALGSTPHIKGCDYENSCVSDAQLRVSGFIAETFFTSLLSARKKSSNSRSDKDTPQTNCKATQSESVSTVRALYRYCLQHKDNHILPDGTKIYEFYQEKRNESMRRSERRKARLIKLAFNNCNFNYDEKAKCYKIWCYFPHTENTVPPAIYYTLGFAKKDVALMTDICHRLTPLKRRYGFVHIVVGGEWEGNHCSIVSKKQILILPQMP